MLQCLIAMGLFVEDVHPNQGFVLQGLIAVGLFVEDDNLEDLTSDRNGLLKGGGFYLLGVQLLCIVCELAWSGLTTYTMLFVSKSQTHQRFKDIKGSMVQRHKRFKGSKT